MSFFFYRKIIKIILPMLAIIIEGLKVQLSNLNLLMRKYAILFEPLAQKDKTDKQVNS